MSAREQADSVSQSRQAFSRSLCRLFLNEKEHWGEQAEGKKREEGRGKGWGGGGGGTFLSASFTFPAPVVGCVTGWMVIYVSSDLYCLELLHSKY